MNHHLTVCVCGAGTMGSGIAQVCAQHGLHVKLYDLNTHTLDAAKNKIEKDLLVLAAKKKISEEERLQIFSRIQFTITISDCTADVVIEAIIEKPEAKAKLFNGLAAINTPDTVFATNTSSLSVTDIAERISRPEKLVGMHFFNPAPVMKLVEVVSTRYADPETISRITALAKYIGKVPVMCKDDPGFIVNHVARPYYLEALYLLEKEMTTMETVDRLLEASGFRMGPFALMDLIGNDINYSVSCIVYDALGKPQRLQPSSLQKEKVEQGMLGRKTGKGYYEYPAR